MKYYSTHQTAKILGYNDDAYIRKLISAGRIKATKIGKSWGISEESLHQYRVENKIEDKFKALISYNYELRSIVDEYLDKPFNVTSARHAISQMFLGKSYKSHAAALKLCEKGFGEDATIIVRSIFENYVNLKYILLADNDSLAERYLAYDFVLQKNMFDTVKKNKNYRRLLKKREAEKRYGDMSIAEIEEAYEAAMNKYDFDQRKGWADESIKKMAGIVGRADQYKTIYRLQCQLSHPSPRGMNTYFNINDEGFVMDIGSNENYVEEALVSLFDLFGSTLDIVADFMEWKLSKKFETILSRFSKTLKEFE